MYGALGRSAPSIHRESTDSVDREIFVLKIFRAQCFRGAKFS